MTSLLLPKAIKPSSIWKKRGQSFWNDARKKFSWVAPVEKPIEHPGRKFGAVEAGWIADLVALRKAIILCWRCQPKFDHRRHNYYRVDRFARVIGRCDGCRDVLSQDKKLYTHESYLGEPGGRTKAGQCWTPM